MCLSIKAHSPTQPPQCHERSTLISSASCGQKSQTSLGCVVRIFAIRRAKLIEYLSKQGGLIGRCTAVLPFVPFTEEEKIVIATEALLMHQADAELAQGLSAATLENAARKSLARYIPAEGARSLHRAVSAMLLDLF